MQTCVLSAPRLFGEMQSLPVRTRPCPAHEALLRGTLSSLRPCAQCVLPCSVLTRLLGVLSQSEGLDYRWLCRADGAGNGLRCPGG
jgi:hypothetical protein